MVPKLFLRELKTRIFIADLVPDSVVSPRLASDRLVPVEADCGREEAKFCRPFDAVRRDHPR